jgi:hypothetical protein
VLSCECGTLKRLICPVRSLTIWTRVKETCIKESDCSTKEDEMEKEEEEEGEGEREKNKRKIIN